jgi:hypothetical protein
MTSASGVAKQYSDDARQRQETLEALPHMPETLRLVTSPDAREALEREMRQRTDRLGSVWVGYHLTAGSGCRRLARCPPTAAKARDEWGVFQRAPRMGPTTCRGP